MKKTIAILLAAVLALTLVACGSGSTTTSPSTSASAAPSSAAPSTAPSSAAPSSAASPSPSAAPSASAAASPSAKDTLGYVTDKADHWNRKPYKIASMALSMTTTYNKMINDGVTKWGKVFNYDCLIYDANHDYDGYINQIQVLHDQGYNGLIVGMDDSLTLRVYELTQELKMPVVGLPTSFKDKDGHIFWPSVEQNSLGNTTKCVQWLADNYKNYWKDPVDESKLGFIAVTFSPVSGIHERVQPMKDTFIKDFPKAAGNFFVADLVTTPSAFSQQGANEITAATISGHAEINKWFVVGAVDDMAVGAARAVESLKKTNDVLVSSVQADAFINEMQSGNTNSCYVAACALSTVEMTGYGVANLLAIIEGRGTAETIWPDHIKAGDKYPCIYVDGTMLTKDTYKDWQQKTSFETISANMKKG